jgi:hypothetical protein
VFNLNYVVWLVPLRVFFNVILDAGTTGWYIELAVDIFFLLDIWFNFRTGFIAEHGSSHQVEMRPAKIRRHYMSGWFFVDFVSVLPGVHTHACSRAQFSVRHSL